MVIEVNFLQPRNAEAPMLVTELGNETLVFPAGQAIKVVISLLYRTPSKVL